MMNQWMATEISVILMPKKYSNITSIHKPNGGKSSVCNAGIDNSDNVYIMVVDLDDWVRLDLLEKLFSKKVKLM